MPSPPYAGQRTLPNSAQLIGAGALLLCFLTLGCSPPTDLPFPEHVLRVAFSSGISSSLDEGETLYRDAAVVDYTFAAKPGFQNPRLVVDGVPAAPAGQVRMDQAHALVATADSVIALTRPDSALIGSLEQTTLRGNPQEVVQTLERVFDSLLVVVPEDSAAPILNRAIAYALVPERDAAVLSAALASAAPVVLRPSMTRSQQLAAIAHTEIVYVNGVMTSPAQLRLAWRGALYPLAQRIGLTAAAGFHVDGFYNRSAAAQDTPARDFLTCMLLKGNQMANGLQSAFLTLPGCLPVGGLVIPGTTLPVGDFVEAVQQVVNLYLLKGNPALVQGDAARLGQRILTYRQEGKRVLLVSHSQGNLMVGEALKYLQAQQAWKSSDYNCVGWVAIAPPITPYAPPPMATPSALIIDGVSTADILALLGVPSGVTPVTNELSDTYDGKGWNWASLLPWFRPGTGLSLHGIVSSYFGMSRTENRIAAELTSQVSHLDQSCSSVFSTVDVSSNVSSSWTLNPGGLTGTGTTGSFALSPAPGGTVYTLTPAPITGRTVTVTNSDGSGSAMTLFPGNSKSFTITYSGGGTTPTVTLGANPGTITAGQTATLTWTSTNATACSAPWTSSTAPSGSQSVTPGATTTYLISCSGPTGTASASAIVTVGAGGNCPAPQVISAPIQTATTLAPGQAGCTHYLVTGIFSVSAALTVQPGTTVAFKSGAGFVLFGSAGSLSAVGTAAAPIRFLGEQAVRGYWQGLQFNDNPANELTWVEVAYGGGAGGYAANVAVAGNGTPRLKLTNSTLRESAGVGLYVGASGRVTFGSNSFRDNVEAGIRIPDEVVGSLDVSSDYTTGNGKAYIDVFAWGVSTPQTWRITSTPLHFSGNTSLSAALTIVPGVRLIFGANTRFDVFTGSLAAVGTATAPIRFLGEQAVRGYWQGLQFNDNPANELTWVEVAYGGGAGGYAANVAVAGNGTPRLKLTNSTLRESAGVGLYVGASGRVTFGSNSFRDNAEAGIRIPDEVVGSLDVSSDYTTGNGKVYIDVFAWGVFTPQTWRITSTPLHFSGNTSLSAALTIVPGVRLIFGANTRFDVFTGSLAAVGTATAPIRFLGEQAVRGYWQGLQFNDNPANELTWVEVAYGGGGGAPDAADVHVTGFGRLKLTHSTLHQSAGWGLWVGLNGVIVPSPVSSGGNAFDNNASGDSNVP